MPSTSSRQPPELGNHLHYVQSYVFMGSLPRMVQGYASMLGHAVSVLLHLSSWRSAEANLKPQDSKTDLPDISRFPNILLLQFYMIKQADGMSFSKGFRSLIESLKIPPRRIGVFIFPKPTYSRLRLALLSKTDRLLFVTFSMQARVSSLSFYRGIFIPA